MHTQLAHRPAATLALVLATLALAGCGELGAEPKAHPGAAGSSVDRVAAAQEACGSYERPCALPEIRVSAAAE
ncbi:MAG TPA: hypothetical protein VHG28_12635 [Longimicrobiaceae bacterium]|nr:hypothetical protein [Longimicrobiaceae bacterium]